MSRSNSSAVTVKSCDSSLERASPEIVIHNDLEPPDRSQDHAGVLPPTGSAVELLAKSRPRRGVVSMLCGLLRAKESQGNHSHPVIASVGLRTGVEDCQFDTAIADLSA